MGSSERVFNELEMVKGEIIEGAGGLGRRRFIRGSDKRGVVEGEISRLKEIRARGSWEKKGDADLHTITKKIVILLIFTEKEA